MQALGIYPVLETIDGSSSVYFESVNHEGIRAYVQRIAEALQVTGQLAFNFIETGFELRVGHLHGSRLEICRI